MSSVQGSGERFVIGPWDTHAGGYVNDARLDGGLVFEMNPEIRQRLVERFGRGDPRINEILWQANQVPIRQAIADGLDFDYSLTRMDPERYGVEREAVQLLAEGEVGDALAVLRSEAMPARLREVELLLRAGYHPIYDDSAQVIRWIAP